MKQPISRTHLEENICVHIFTVSAAMVGVCMTAISLLRVVITLRKADTLADDFIAGDTVLFLISCLLSYWALRMRHIGRMHRVERIADYVFVAGLFFMAAISVFITYAISAT